MKILLTGHPRVGKSTLIQKVTKRLKPPFRGIVAKELRNNEGNREGFEARNFRGESILFAHTFKIQSDAVVGNKYRVDLQAINSFVVPEITPSAEHPEELIIIDEIGRMQSMSPLFLKTVSSILDSDTSFLGTIVLDPEPWSLVFKQHPEVLLIEVNEKNRRQLPQILLDIIEAQPLIQQLSKAQQLKLLELLRQYLPNNQRIQIKKLLANAIPYVVRGAAQKISGSTNPECYTITGNTGTHLVLHTSENVWSCDCDLFTGAGDYVGKSGECSHIQASKLLESEAQKNTR